MASSFIMMIFSQQRVFPGAGLFDLTAFANKRECECERASVQLKLCMPQETAVYAGAHIIDRSLVHVADSER